MPPTESVESQPIGRGTTHDLNGSKGKPWCDVPGS
jgi:hypothetical protein